MNERIKELAAVAWEYADLHSRDGDGIHGHLYRDKFAELIVRECADISDASFHDGSAGYLAILNNFGVK